MCVTGYPYGFLYVCVGVYSMCVHSLLCMLPRLHLTRLLSGDNMCQGDFTRGRFTTGKKRKDWVFLGFCLTLLSKVWMCQDPAANTSRELINNAKRRGNTVIQPMLDRHWTQYNGVSQHNPRTDFKNHTKMPSLGMCLCTWAISVCRNDFWPERDTQIWLWAIQQLTATSINHIVCEGMDWRVTCFLPTRSHYM